MQARPVRCLCVCLHVCVCMSRSYIVSKRINISSTFFTIRYPSRSSVPVLNGMAINRREPPNRGVKCRWVGKNRDSEPISGFTACCQRCDRLGVINASPPDHGPASCDTRRSLLIAGDDDEMFMTRSLNVTPMTTEQHLIARSDKSIAYVINSKRLFDVLYY